MQRNNIALGFEAWPSEARLLALKKRCVQSKYLIVNFTNENMPNKVLLHIFTLEGLSDQNLGNNDMISIFGSD